MSRRRHWAHLLGGNCCGLLVIAAFAWTVSAQGVFLGPTDVIGFDYFDQDLVDFSVSDFEASWDGQGWMPLGTLPAIVNSTTQAGAHTYLVASPFATGAHTVSVRACNAMGCGAASAAFPFVHGAVPSKAPSNLRKVTR